MNTKITAQQARQLIAGTHYRDNNGEVRPVRVARATNLDKHGFPLHAGNPVWMD